MKLPKHSPVVVASFLLGVFLYVLAALSTFNLAEFAGSDRGFVTLIALTSLAGLAAMAVGYVLVVTLGGWISLPLAEFIARVTGSSHVVEIVEERPQSIWHRLTRHAFPLYIPALVFIISLTLSWDVHNLHDPRMLIFHQLFHSLDLFSRVVNLNPISYSGEVLPAMIVLITISGIAPAIALPYFRRFKITGVNNGPFHTFLLFTVLGLVISLSVLFTVIGLIFKVLWVGKGPASYHYVLLTMLGLSLHHAIGAYLGRDRSEEIIRVKLEAETGKRVTLGTVSIQKRRARNRQDKT